MQRRVDLLGLARFARADANIYKNICPQIIHKGWWQNCDTISGRSYARLASWRPV